MDWCWLLGLKWAHEYQLSLVRTRFSIETTDFALSNFSNVSQSNTINATTFLSNDIDKNISGIQVRIPSRARHICVKKTLWKVSTTKTTTALAKKRVQLLESLKQKWRHDSRQAKWMISSYRGPHDNIYWSESVVLVFLRCILLAIAECRLFDDFLLLSIEYLFSWTMDDEDKVSLHLRISKTKHRAWDTDLVIYFSCVQRNNHRWIDIWQYCRTHRFASEWTFEILCYAPPLSTRSVRDSSLHIEIV